MSAEPRYPTQDDIPPAEVLALKFGCPQCGRDKGEPCVWRQRPAHGGATHLARLDKGTKLWWRYSHQIIDAADARIEPPAWFLTTGGTR